MASRANNTPPINATGVFEVISPFTLQAGAIYRCEAIEGFEALEEKGINVFSTYYEPNGVAVEDYNDDDLNGINIITLISDNAATILIPSSFIKSFPNTVNVPYSRMILSVDLGVLPDGVDLVQAKDVIASEVSEVVGTPASVDLHKLSSEDPVSFSQHEMLENNRLENIRVRETPYAALKRQVEIEAALRNRIEILERIILDQKAVIDAI